MESSIAIERQEIELEELQEGRVAVDGQLVGTLEARRKRTGSNWGGGEGRGERLASVVKGWESEEGETTRRAADRFAAGWCLNITGGSLRPELPLFSKFQAQLRSPTAPRIPPAQPGKDS